MADNEISILVKAEVAKALGDLKKVQDAPNDIKKGFDGLVDKVKSNFVAIGAAAVAMYASIKKGAESIKIASEFAEQSDAVAKQFGVTADQILAKLRESTKGMVSDVDLLKAASRAMALGVSTDIGTLGKLFEFADVKSKTLGKSVEETFSLMVEGIGRQNPRMLKELGFTADALKGTEDGAKGALSKAELLAIVMGEATPTIGKFGDSVVSSADAFAVMTANGENLKLQLGQALLPVFDKLVPAIRGLTTLLMGAPPALKVVGIAMLALVPIGIALWTSLGPIGLVMGAIALVAAGFAVKIGQVADAEEKLKKQNDALRSSLGEGVWNAQTESLKRFANALKSHTNDALKYLEVQLSSGMVMNELTRQLERATEGNKALASAQLAAVKAQLALNEAGKNGDDKPDDPELVKKRIQAAKDAYEVIRSIEQKGLDSRLVAIDKALADENLKDSKAIQALKDTRIRVAGEIAQEEARINAEKLEEKKKQEEQYYIDLALISINAAAQITDSIFAYDQTVRDAKLAADIAAIDRKNQYTDEIAALAQAKEEERNAQTLADLEAQLAAETDIVKKAAIQKQIDKFNSDAAYDAQVAALKVNEAARNEQIAKQERKLRYDAAVQDKGAKRAMAVINAAVAITNALATIPFPFGLIASAGIGVSTGFQIAAIDATPLPALATGGLVRGPQAIVAGERGVEAVLPNDLTELLLSAAGEGRGGATVNIGQVVANDPQQFAAALDRHIKTRGNLLSI